MLKPSLPGSGLPLSISAWPTQLVKDRAVTLNSRENSAGVRLARTSSTICCLNSAGYGDLNLDICGTLNTKNDVSTEPGQLQVQLQYGCLPRSRMGQREAMKRPRFIEMQVSYVPRLADVEASQLCCYPHTWDIESKLV